MTRGKLSLGHRWVPTKWLKAWMRRFGPETPEEIQRRNELHTFREELAKKEPKR